MDTGAVARRFQRLFGKSPLMIRAPARVNLIGEHTDYNDGFVLPAAIDFELAFAVGTNNANRLRLFAEDLDESFEHDPRDLRVTGCGWANYFLGVLAQFQKRGIGGTGFDCVFGGNIPIGAGLSSSAALEVGFAIGVNHLTGAGIDNISLARMAQAAEHEYAGVRCGIMDQFVCLMGKAGQAMKLDCRSLEFEYCPANLLPHYKIVLCNTNVEHELAMSEYNTRRRECEQGVELLRQHESSIRSLRDVSLELLLEHRGGMDPSVFRRCKHVLEENKRVMETCDHLRRKDIAAVGQTLHQSHAGLKNDYEVSCAELDILEEIAREDDAVAGSRMMGGGFGGCTINIVQCDEVDRFSESIRREYTARTGRAPAIYAASMTNGASIQET